MGSTRQHQQFQRLGQLVIPSRQSPGDIERVNNDPPTPFSKFALRFTQIRFQNYPVYTLILFISQQKKVGPWLHENKIARTQNKWILRLKKIVDRLKGPPKKPGWRQRFSPSIIALDRATDRNDFNEIWLPTEFRWVFSGESVETRFSV
ncbi:MAG: hypothetical protein ACUVTX_10030 [Bacteroidales bacterium]